MFGQGAAAATHVLVAVLAVPFACVRDEDMAVAAEQQHPFPPVFDKDSRVLIIGSFPSVKSRAVGFYYGNPRNRFWPVLQALTGDAVPGTIDGRITFVLEHGIALFDVLESCEIAASSDASIRKAVPNRFDEIFDTADIRGVFANGRTAYRYFTQYVRDDAQYLPSTSPANAQWTLQKLVEAWRVIVPYLR